MINESFLKVYLNNKVLVEAVNGSGEYRIKRPCKIIFQKNVIDKLFNIYKPDSESGGLLELVSFESGVLSVVDFHHVPNTSILSYNYNPDRLKIATTINDILLRGSMPIMLHTHPTHLNIESYDKQQTEFYLRSSPQDRALSRAGLVEKLNLPECIFVKNENFTNGFALSLYTGVVFPQSSSALSTLQIVSGGAALLIKNKAVKLLSLAAFGLEQFRKPKYNYLKSGGVEVVLSI